MNQSALESGDAKISYSGQGGGVGFTMSMLAKPMEKIHIGFQYRSRVNITNEGDFEMENIAPALRPLFGGDSYKSDAEISQDMPQMIGIGLAYMPFDALTLETDFQWTEWSVFDRSTLHIEDKAPEAGITDVSTEMNWKDTWVICIGAEYRPDEQWALRCGYFFTENQIPDESVHPASPEADNHTLNMGVGYKNEKITIDAAYSFQLPADRDADNEILKGEYTNTIHCFGMSFGYAF